LPTQ